MPSSSEGQIEANEDLFQAGNFAAIMLAVKERIIDCVDDAGPTNVRIMSANPGSGTGLPVPAYVISPSGSMGYDQAAFAGGGQAQTTVRTEVIVTCKAAGASDKVDEIEAWFFKQERARLAILSALTAFMPMDEESKSLTNEPFVPARGAWSKDKTMGEVQVVFSIEFDEKFIIHPEV